MRTLILTIIAVYQLQISFVHPIIKHHKFVNFHDMSEVCGKIIESCFSKDANNLILYGNDDHLILYTVLHKKQTLNLIYNSTYNFHKIQYFGRPAIFIITVNNYEDLKNSLKDLRSFPLWDIKRPFFILNKNTDTKACDNVYEYLYFTWTYNLLSSYFICYENKQIMIWTFNPFTNFAPKTWNLMKISKKNHQNRWTLFRQLYNPSFHAYFCKNFHWDKTKKLNGYPVKAIGTHAIPSLTIDSHYVNMNKWKGIDGRIMQIIFSSMDVNPVITYNETGITGKIDANDNPSGMYKELAVGTQDVMMNSMFMRYLNNTTIIPLNLMSGIKFIVQKKKNMSTMKKIVRYLGFSLIAVTIGITLMTLGVLKYFSKRSTMLAVLEIIRLLANSGLLKPPSATSARLYLGPVLFFYISFQAIFQGELAALLTKPVPEIDLHSPSDLKTHPGYKLYIAEAITSYVHPEIKNLSHKIPSISCEKYVLESPKAVCITSEGFLTIPTAKYDLHMPSQQLYSNFEIYRIRKDWPLENKFRNIVLSINQAGILNMWKEKSMNYSKQKIKQLRHINNIPKFNIVKMADLMFAFKGLIYGLFLSLFIYCFEIKIWLKIAKIFRKY